MINSAMDLDELESLARVGRSDATNENEEFRQAVMRVGGYDGPSWLRDGRPKPLRDAMGRHTYFTLLRRMAVVRLKMHGLSFRQIGVRLGFSHVAAWKLWRQVVDDLQEQDRAFWRGEGILGAEFQEELAMEDDEFCSMSKPRYELVCSTSKPGHELIEGIQNG